MRINTALILCAGFGKRLSPLTLEVPKPLLLDFYMKLDAEITCKTQTKKQFF